jgi:uncharacterized membrane protein
MTHTPPASSTHARGTTAANLRAVVEIERQNLQRRSAVQAMTDRVTAASSFPFVLFHLVWFASWIGVNTLSTHHFDPFPFNLLTMIVSLEVILLTAFVLMSQNHLTLIVAQELDTRGSAPPRFRPNF